MCIEELTWEHWSIKVFKKEENPHKGEVGGARDDPEGRLGRQREPQAVDISRHKGYGSSESKPY